MEPDGDGGLVSRTPGLARGPALYHLARSRQSDTWPSIAVAGTPVLLLLATHPDQARAVSESGLARFSAVLPAADVRWVDGATHSLVTDQREDLGAAVVDWLSGLS
jgi:hypothetical protein